MDVGLDDRRLRQTATKLIALAVLAERAAGRSFLVRWFVLSLLRYAERAARSYVADIMQCAWPELVDQLDWPGFDHDLKHGSGPGDAALLAERLRLLAALLGALLPPDDQLYGETYSINRANVDGASRSSRYLACRLPATSAGWTLQAPDTS